MAKIDARCALGRKISGRFALLSCPHDLPPCLARTIDVVATRNYIRYRSDYKHQLAEGYVVEVPILPNADIKSEFIALDIVGQLTIKMGYAWDGPSGPVIDTTENMRASLVHDALYQLMRQGHLSSHTWRKTADQVFRDLCKADGVSGYRANTWYRALRNFGKPAASPEGKKRIHRAP